MIEGLLMLIAGLTAFFSIIWFTVWIAILLPARMAEERRRSAVGWVLASIACSPLVAILLLWVLGDHPDKARDGKAA